MNRCYKYYHQNHIGSTALLTDNIGEKFQSYLYMPYGETWVVENGLNAINDQNGDGIADDVNHLFTGQEYDKETGLYYYNARYYDPHLGMFMRPDPAKDGLNHYAYANCNPVMYNDPTGMYDSAAASAHAASYGVSYGNDTSVSAGYSASYVSYMTSVHAASYGVNYNNDTTVNNKGLWFHVGKNLSDDLIDIDKIPLIVDGVYGKYKQMTCAELEKMISDRINELDRRFCEQIENKKGYGILMICKLIRNKEILKNNKYIYRKWLWKSRLS